MPTQRARRLSLLCLLLAVLFSPLQAQNADWLTWGHDPQRSGWAVDERTLSPENVSRLELKWKAKVPNEAKALASLTAPLVASGVVTPQGVKTLVYVAGSANHIFALDAADGAVVWKRTFESYVAPAKKDQWLCPNNLNATPVIDKRANTIYVIQADGRLVGLDLGTGSVKFGPLPFVPPYSKNWSLNLVDGVVYTSLSQGCGGGKSGLVAMDVRDASRATVWQLVTNERGGGIWGRGGPVVGENRRIYAATGDGPWSPLDGQYGSSIVSVTLGAMKVADYYTPLNWRDINRYDWDISCTSPVYFAFGDYNLVAVGGKEGVVYLMDADAPGGKDHHTPLHVTPRLSNDEDSFEGKGVWGALSMWREDGGQVWVYMPTYGPVSKHAPKFPITNGANPDGSIMAFRVVSDAKTGRPTLAPAWVSGNFGMPDPPVVANGVLFALSTGENVRQTREGGVINWNKLTLLTDAEREGRTQPAVLYALDARTGKELYNSGAAMEKWVHFSGLAVANGRVYAADHASNVYSFGLKEQAKDKAAR